MKRWWLLCLFTLLGGGLLGLGITEDPGFVLISWDGYVLECSFWTGLGLAILIYGGSGLVLHLLLKIIQLPEWLTQWSARRNVLRAHQWLAQGMRELSLGAASKAEQYLLRAARRSIDPFPALIGAATAAEQVQAIERALHYLDQAVAHRPNSPAAGMLKARCLIRNQRWEEASLWLHTVNQQFPTEPNLRTLQLTVLIHLQRWNELNTALCSISRRMRNRHPDLQQMELQAHAQVMLQMTAQATRINAAQVAQRLEEYVQKLPRSVRNQPAISLAQIEALIQLQQHDAASVLLLPLLKSKHKPTFDPALKLSAQLHPSDASPILQALGSLRQQEPNNPTILYALARLQRHCGHPQEAQTLLESALVLQKDPQYLTELLDLLLSQQRDAQSLLILNENLPYLRQHLHPLASIPPDDQRQPY